jgi:hypothetical protein
MGSSFSAAQLQAALATCDLPHGPAVATATEAEVNAQIVGAWLPCPPGDPGGSVYSPGLILSANGQWTRLISDGDGGLVAGMGVQNQGQWSEPSEDVCGCVSPYAPPVQLNVNDSSGSSCSETMASFELSPRRMYVIDHACDSDGTTNVWLVPL